MILIQRYVSTFITLLCLSFLVSAEPSSCLHAVDNSVLNGSFEEDLSNWIYHNSGSGSASVSSVDPQHCDFSAKLDFTASGNNVQLYQRTVALDADTDYTFSFTAKASTPRTIRVFLHKHTSPYNDYGLGTITANLTTEWQTFTYNFKSKGFSGSVNNGRLRFWLVTARPGDTLFFDNVIIQKEGIEPPQLVAPSILSQPQDRSAFIDQTATFSVSAQGTAPLQYQWQREEQDIVGANSASYTIDTLVATDDGALFSVDITNSVGTVTSNTAQLTVSVTPNQTPSASFSVNNSSGIAPLTVNFDASASIDSDGTIDSYSWDFGNGETDTGITPSYIFNTPGVYTVSLTIMDNEGESDTTTTNISVSAIGSQLPTAVFSATPLSGIAPLAVDFDASASTDPDGNITAYSWDFGDGNSETGVTTSHTFDTQGIYNVTLTVTDNNNNTASVTTTITVDPELSAILPKDASRFLTQSTFGPTVSSIQHLVGLESYEKWIDEQINLPPSYHRPFIKTALFKENGQPAGQFGRMNRWWDVVVYSEDQLRQRVAFALSEIFVVSDVNDLLRNPRDTLAEYYDILVRQSFGDFRDLLEDVTLSPAMAVYLSMLANSKPDPRINRQADENYAREILQLFSIGLVELKNNGLPRQDSNGKPIETYIQSDIVNLARIFTGWSWDSNRYIKSSSAGNRQPELVSKPMIAFDSYHDQNEKIFFGVTFPAGQTAKEDLDLALDIIFNHPNVGPFIGKQLIMRLVTSNPSLGYVSRITEVFNNNGNGKRGDLQAVVKAILLDPEARDSRSIKFGKLKEPLIRLTHLWRAFHASPRKKIAPKNAKYLAFHYYNPEQQLSQAPLRSPSVFNFFRPDFSPLGKIKTEGLVAPEFNITSESRLQKSDDAFIRFAIDGGYRRSDPVNLDLTDELVMIENPEELIDYLDVLLTSGNMSTGLKNILLNYLSNNRINTDNDEKIIRNIIALIISSAEYSIQR